MPFLIEIFPEHLVFGPQILDHELLLAVDPTCQDEEKELPGMQDEVHLCSGC